MGMNTWGYAMEVTSYVMVSFLIENIMIFGHCCWRVSHNYHYTTFTTIKPKIPKS